MLNPFVILTGQSITGRLLLSSTKYNWRDCTHQATTIPTSEQWDILSIDIPVLTISFPSTHIPNALTRGDIALIPNAKMFIVMGDNPGRFFEITNYNTGVGNATANFIQDMPRPCYGIAYLNGKIEFTGTDFGGNCYRYMYDIPSHVMGAE